MAESGSKLQGNADRNFFKKFSRTFFKKYVENDSQEAAMKWMLEYSPSIKGGEDQQNGL